MKYVFMFLFSILFFSVSYAQKPNDLLMQISDLGMNLEFEKANKQIDDYLKKNPNDPLGWFTRQSIKYWEFAMFPDNEKVFEEILESADKAIELSEDLSDKNPKNGFYYFIMGGAYGFKGMALAEHQSILKAAWAGKKGNDNLKKCLELDSNNEDNYLGLGIFNYMISRIPTSFRWVVNIVGFEGDKEKGLAYLKRTSEKGIYAKGVATYFYAQYSYWEGRYDESYTYYRKCTEKYPANVVFRSSMGNALMNLDRPGEALEQFRQVYNSQFEKRISGAKYQALRLSFEMGKETEFKEILDWNISKANSDKTSKSYASLAYSYLKINQDLGWIKGYTDQQIEQVKKLSEGERNTFYDNRNHSPYFVKFWDALKLYNKQEFVKSIDLLKGIPESDFKNWSEDDTRWYYQTLANSGRKSDNFPIAVKGYSELKKICEKNKWENQVAKVNQRLLEMYTKANQRKQGETVLKEIKDSDYYEEYVSYKKEIDDFALKSGYKI